MRSFGSGRQPREHLAAIDNSSLLVGGFYRFQEGEMSMAPSRRNHHDLRPLAQPVGQLAFLITRGKQHHDAAASLSE